MRYFFKVVKGDALFDVVYGNMIVTMVEAGCITAETLPATAQNQVHQAWYNLDGRLTTDNHEIFQRLYYRGDAPKHNGFLERRPSRVGEITRCGRCNSADVAVIPMSSKKNSPCRSPSTHILL